MVGAAAEVKINGDSGLPFLVLNSQPATLAGLRRLGPASVARWLWELRGRNGASD